MTVEVESPNRAPAVAARMAEAAKRFLSTLTDEQRRVAAFPFLGDERYKWNYRPMESMPRNGLWLIAMTAEQRQAALALLETGLSARAFDQARRIMEREAVLREHERADLRITNMVRDPELYWWSVFGQPGDADSWGWRVSGHHIGVHFTIVGGDLIASTPFFLGCNPAEVRIGPQTGDRVLPAEEDMARDLLAALDEPRKALAIYSPVAPSDIRTDIHRQVWPGVLPRGLALSGMDARQRGKLVDLIRYYVGRASDDLAGDAWRRVERGGLEAVTFAWAGPEEKGSGHYYAVSGPTFMLEYDNTQNGANHIHSVWREWQGDWGEDLLAAHYQAAHDNGSAHSH
jgi:hypothetical protein